MRLSRHRSAATAALLAAVAAISGCGLQQVGVNGVVTAQGVGPGTSDGGTGTLPNGQPSPGASLGPGGVPVTNGGTQLPGGSGVVGGGSPGTVGGGSGPTFPGSGGGSTQVTPGLKGTINVSYVAVTGFDQLSQVVDVSAAWTGDSNAQRLAVEKYVNSHGGIGGRRLVTHLREYNAMQASAANDTALCNAIVGDDKSSFAVIHGQIHPEARDCYKKAKVMALEGGQYGWSQEFFDQHAPYFAAPAWPAYDQILLALVDSAKRRNWFQGVAKVGIIDWDETTYKSLRDKVLIPALKKVGYTDSTIVTADVPDADIGSISSGLQTAATKMIQNGVTHLMFVGSNPLQPFFIQQAGNSSPFVYALTSFDTPRYMAVNFPGQMVGSIGVGSNPITDVLDGQYSFPQPGMEKFCVDMYKSYGVSVPHRYQEKDKNKSGDKGFDSKQAMSYCELTMLIKKVADSLPYDYTVAEWTAQMDKLGTSFGMAQDFTTSLDSTNTGATSWRDLVWDASCKTPTGTGCYKYAEPLRSFG
jgi:hypothetical protein